MSRETLVERIVTRLRREAVELGLSKDAEVYVYGPPFVHRAADIVAREFGSDQSEGNDR